MTQEASIVMLQSGDAPEFRLRTSRCELILTVTAHGHLSVRWFGVPVPPGNDLALSLPSDPAEPIGHRIDYDGATPYSLSTQKLAWSSRGKGDYREPAIELLHAGTLDLSYVSAAIQAPTVATEGLPRPSPEPGSASLAILLSDEVAGVECLLTWTTFPEAGVISTNARVRNRGSDPVRLRRIASLLIDLPNRDYELLTLDGHWAGEAHAHRLPLGPRKVTNESTTGSSSTSHNPGLILAAADTTEDSGTAIGFNLLYSGDHHTVVEADTRGRLRVVSGINPVDFLWELAPGEEFHTPEAVIGFSGQGLNGLSQAFHCFVDNNVIPARWRHRERPVVLNSWEATYFDFTEDSLVQLGRGAAALGAEVLVVDDGWFSTRSGDTSGLGDWWPNPHKFPGGLGRLATRLADVGVGLGIWFEPESVNEDSELFRLHPEWVIKSPGRRPSTGRSQLLLDLSRPDVRNYLVEAMGNVLDSAPISFVKWDMNRLISDAEKPGFHHRYVLGLYDVLRRTFEGRPDILLETCSGGGNRFDLGMLSFGPQVWASDCTDPVERLNIQHGLSYLYPTSTISAHVSPSPNHQTRRTSPLAFRAAVAATGVLGLELDPGSISAEEASELRNWIAWYKKRRRLLQFGVRSRGEGPGNRQVTIADGRDAVLAAFDSYVWHGTGQAMLRQPGLAAEATAVVQIRHPLSSALSWKTSAAALRSGIPREGRASSQEALILELQVMDQAN